MAETSNPEKKERGPSYLDNIRGDRPSKVTHYRFIKVDGIPVLKPLYDIRSAKLQKKLIPYGGAVKVVVKDSTTGENHVGYSFCSLNDRFEKRGGNVGAFSSALNKINCNAKKGEEQRCKLENEHTSMVLSKIKKYLHRDLTPEERRAKWKDIIEIEVNFGKPEEEKVD